MNRQVYTLGLYLLSPIVLIYFLYRGIKDPRYLKYFFERLGIIKLTSQQKTDQINTNSKSILVHCASLGETKAAIPFITKLVNDNKFSRIVITNTTPTGRAETEKLIDFFSSHHNQSIQFFNFYLPIDWPLSCKRFIRKLSPDIVVLMETELWPNFIHQCDKRNIPVVLANARMSKRSSSRYQRYPQLTKDLFSGISKIAAQYESDKAQFLNLNIQSQKIESIGSIKFDIKLSETDKVKQRELKASWLKGRLCWIACSIHPGEFSDILNCHKKLLTYFPELLLIAVPRHPEQFEKLKDMATEMEINFISRSEQKAPQASTQLMIGDTMGELLLLCGVADIAFVGGSLIDRGAHNPLEPAVCGLPVVMGESVYNFSDVSQIMLNYETLDIVKNREALTQIIKSQLSDQRHTSPNPEKTERLFRENGQSVSRLCEIIYQYLK